jgi:tetratricopeptide (TPR) repeat protein
MRIAALALAASASFGAYWCVLHARANALSLRVDLGAREQSVMLAPTSATAWLRLADLRAENNLPVTECLRRAVAASPQRSEAWIQLGLDAEARNDFDDAERDLLQAAEVDHDYIPRWTLANYYFRRQDRVQFFKWARNTLVWGRGNYAPLFRMCRGISTDEAEILNAAIPSRPEVLSDHLNWLGSQDLDDAAPVAAALMERFPQEGRLALLVYCDRLIGANRVADAVALWNSLNQRHIVASGTEQVDKITDGDFQSAPANAGFDWRIAAPPAIEVTPTLPGLSLNFPGSQPDRAEVVNQFVLVRAETSYRLRFDIEASGVEAGSGLRWVAIDARKNALLQPAIPLATLMPPDFAAATSGHGEITFAVPSSKTDEPTLLRLALIYERPPGSAPMQGWIRLHRVWLEEIAK